MSEIFDLFGDPVPDNHGRRGRPQHLPTCENRRRVSMLLACGWNNERIAAAMRITQPTLRRHYFSELKERVIARDRLDLAMMMNLWKQVEAGNVGAVKEFRKMLETNDLMNFGSLPVAHARREEERETKPERLGKKEAANRAAETAHEGTTWNDLLQ